VWRILNKIIPVRESLSKRGIRCNILCPICDSKMETISHCFMTCDRAKRVWFRFPLTINLNRCPEVDFSEWLIQCVESENKETLSIMFSIINGIWMARNAKVHENKDISIQDLVEKSINSYNNAIW